MSDNEGIVLFFAQTGRYRRSLPASLPQIQQMRVFGIFFEG